MVFLSLSDLLLRKPSAKPRGGFFAFCDSPARHSGVIGRALALTSMTVAGVMDEATMPA